jgi:Uma2 family endonuclease
MTWSYGTWGRIWILPATGRSADIPVDIPVRSNVVRLAAGFPDSLAFCRVRGTLVFMAVAQNIARLSEAEYLRLEREAETRSEYFDGEVFAMAGGTSSHSLIATNLLGELRSGLKATDCVAYNTDLRVKVEATGLLTYPDVSVVCGERRFLDEQEDTLLNPTVVIEVLSDSTEGYDRGKKFENYRQIPSCCEYLLVSQKEPRIEQFIRQPNGEWTLKEAAGLSAVTELPSLGVVLELREVFAKVQFTPVRLRAST